MFSVSLFLKNYNVLIIHFNILSHGFHWNCTTMHIKMCYSMLAPRGFVGSLWSWDPTVGWWHLATKWALWASHIYKNFFWTPQKNVVWPNVFLTPQQKCSPQILFHHWKLYFNDKKRILLTKNLLSLLISPIVQVMMPSGILS
jgi:hypothetical protein